MKKVKGSTWLLWIGIAVFLVGCIGPFRYEDAIENGYRVEATAVCFLFIDREVLPERG